MSEKLFQIQLLHHLKDSYIKILLNHGIGQLEIYLKKLINGEKESSQQSR